MKYRHGLDIAEGKMLWYIVSVVEGRREQHMNKVLLICAYTCQGELVTHLAKICAGQNKRMNMRKI